MSTTNTEAKILWIELTQDYFFTRDENDAPYGLESYEEALESHNEDKAEHQEQIENGEREADDVYEYELVPVHVKGDMMEILDPNDNFSVIETINWKEQ